MSTRVGYGTDTGVCDYMQKSTSADDPDNPEAVKGCSGLMLFHALHSWLGVMLVNSEWESATGLWFIKVVKQSMHDWKLPLTFASVLFLVNEVLFSTAIYALDMQDHCYKCRTVDKETCEPGAQVYCRDGYMAQLVTAFYFSLMTFSGVGYGDVTPFTDWGKAFSPILMTLGTSSFETVRKLLNANTAEDQEWLLRDDQFAAISAFHKTMDKCWINFRDLQVFEPKADDNKNSTWHYTKSSLPYKPSNNLWTKNFYGKSANKYKKSNT